MAKSEKKDYLPDTPVAFQDIKAYIGVMKDELVRTLHYYMYVCYGKNYRQTAKYSRVDFLITSLELAKNSHNNLARDIKEWKHLYQEALDELLKLVNDSEPHKTDEYSLKLILGFHHDMEKVIKTVMKSKRSFMN